MADRTTTKSDINTLNVPTVTNADLNTMLQNYMCDNMKFREDVVATQNSSVSAITCDFTGKDRINLTRTGGYLSITLSGLDDGDRKFLLITKTAGQNVSFAGGVIDTTPITPIIDDLSSVLYEILRKGSDYYARAYYATVQIASQSEGLAGTSNDKVMSPIRCAQRDGGLITEVIEIGDWDMQADSTVSVSLGTISYSDVVQVTALIRNDADTTRIPLSSYATNNRVIATNISSDQVLLSREPSGMFDSTDYNASSYNRGWVVVKYLD